MMKKSASEVEALGLTVLHLTFDPSPTAAHEVQVRLDKLERAGNSAETEPLHSLLLDGHLLQDLVPTAAELAKAAFALPISQQLAATRTIVLQHQTGSREKARGFRVLLCGISVVLLGALPSFCFRTAVTSACTQASWAT